MGVNAGFAHTVPYISACTPLPLANMLTVLQSYVANFANAAWFLPGDLTTAMKALEWHRTDIDVMTGQSLAEMEGLGVNPNPVVFSMCRRAGDVNHGAAITWGTLFLAPLVSQAYVERS